MLSIDGPYGTCAEDIFKYSTAVLVGAGIGVTPYSSILKHIWYMASRHESDIKLKKIYFFWICSIGTLIGLMWTYILSDMLIDLLNSFVVIF